MTGKHYRILLINLILILTSTTSLQADDGSRLALIVSGGGGSLQVADTSQFSPVFSLALLVHITDHVSAEGGIDFFWHKLLTGPLADQKVFWDDYTGAEAAVLYHFRPARESERWIPFVAAGIGSTSTDFTEIEGSRYYRLGGGASYYFGEKWGVRIEVRDEIVERLWIPENHGAHLPSLRFGLVRRF
ncbi:MAG TPA: outer membrane beta-barrel protein [Acidobacteriota bacterium]|nr:outer membrane beta-barrel protein [Acidobacteriota bacterium]